MTHHAQKAAADLLPKPVHTRVFTVSNQKGGVGKTSTAVNLAAALAEAGLNVLVIDNDPQGNALTALGIEHGVDAPSVYNVLIEDKPLAKIVQECPDMPGLFCAPANIDLAGAEIELVSLVARETRLKNALVDYTEWREKQGMPRLDYVFIDCPPSLGLLTVNAFVAAEEILIPIQCEYYALEGLSQLLKNIQMIQKHLNSKLRISTILLTMYDARTNLAFQVAEEVREHFPQETLGVKILAPCVSPRHLATSRPSSRTILPRPAPALTEKPLRSFRGVRLDLIFEYAVYYCRLYFRHPLRISFEACGGDAFAGNKLKFLKNTLYKFYI